MKLYWHIHHQVLLEPLTEPIKYRIAYIKENKPTREIETRLRLLKPVKGKLPKAVVRAGEVYSKTGTAYVKARRTFDKAREAYDKARKAYAKAREAFVKARKAYFKVLETFDKAGEDFHKTLANHKPEIKALHKLECPNCPWNGKTIFP